MFMTMMAMLRRDDGQGLVEYALIIALVAMATIVVLRSLSQSVSRTLNNAASSLS